MPTPSIYRLVRTCAFVAILWPAPGAAQTAEPDSTVRVGDLVSLHYLGRHVSGIVTELDDSLSVDSWRGRRTIAVSTEMRIRKRIGERPRGTAFVDGSIRGGLAAG